MNATATFASLGDSQWLVALLTLLTTLALVIERSWRRADKCRRAALQEAARFNTPPLRQRPAESPAVSVAEALLPVEGVAVRRSGRVAQTAAESSA